MRAARHHGLGLTTTTFHVCCSGVPAQSAARTPEPALNSCAMLQQSFNKRSAAKYCNHSQPLGRRHFAAWERCRQTRREQPAMHLSMPRDTVMPLGSRYSKFNFDAATQRPQLIFQTYRGSTSAVASMSTLRPASDAPGPRFISAMACGTLVSGRSSVRSARSSDAP
jgi:hypothetical protein